jgi:predicted transcriptional regulator
MDRHAMASASFTHRMDPELRAELERIARFEDRSASYVANQAIRAFIAERQATRELVREGLRQIVAGAPSLSADEVRDWFLAADERPFPDGRKAP